MHPPSFPSTSPQLGAPLPSTGSGRVPFPCFISTIRALRLPAVHPAALRLLRLAVPPVCTFFAPANAAHGAREPGGFGCRVPPSGMTSGNNRASHVPGGPPCASALLSDPGRIDPVRPPRRADVAPANSTTKAPTSILSRLHHTASALAVYASQGRLLDRHARLASGCWPGFTGWV